MGRMETMMQMMLERSAVSTNQANNKRQETQKDIRGESQPSRIHNRRRGEDHFSDHDSSSEEEEGATRRPSRRATRFSEARTERDEPEENIHRMYQEERRELLDLVRSVTLNVSQSRNEGSFKPPKIHVKTFNNTQQDITTFLDQFERLAEHSGWGEENKIKFLDYYTESEPRDFIENYRRQHRDTSWGALKKRLIEHYVGHSTRLHFQKKLLARVRDENEKMGEYITEVQSLCFKTNVNMEEDEMREHIMKGLGDGDKKLMASMSDKPFDQVIRALEIADSYQEELDTTPETKFIGGMEISPRKTDNFSKFNKNNNNNNNNDIKCFICQKRGHLGMNCRIRGNESKSNLIKCRFCGKFGHKERWCRAKLYNKNYEPPHQFYLGDLTCKNNDELYEENLFYNRSESPDNNYDTGLSDHNESGDEKEENFECQPSTPWHEDCDKVFITDISSEIHCEKEREIAMDEDNDFWKQIPIYESENEGSCLTEVCPEFRNQEERVNASENYIPDNGQYTIGGIFVSLNTTDIGNEYQNKDMKADDNDDNLDENDQLSLNATSFLEITESESGLEEDSKIGDNEDVYCNIEADISSVPENPLFTLEKGEDISSNINRGQRPSNTYHYNLDPDIDDEVSLDSDTLGTEGGSSWASEDQTASPGSSCATPNSTTEGADSELSFTVGITDGTPHACRFCDKAFPRHSYLKKHEQTHADCMPFRCEYCRRLFKHKRSRDRHIKLHTGDKKYRCTQCDAAFSRSDHLKIHMKTHDNQKPFQCTVCNRGYNTAAALTSHMQNHKKNTENQPVSTIPSGPTFKCLQCAEVFRKPEELQNHMNSHPQSEDMPSAHRSSKNSSSLLPALRFTCTYCTKDNFNSMELLQSHVHSAHKSIINGDIQKELSNLSYQTNHANVNIHSQNLLDSPPLQTNHSFPSSLPSYFCELCTMRFSSLHALQKHTTAVHGFNSLSSYNGFKHVSVPQDLINNGKLYCAYCAIHFLTPASFAEHYIIFHTPYHPQLLGFTPPEQVKPTDLTVNRKSPSKRSTPEDQRLSPRKKSRTPNESISSTSSTPVSSNSMTRAHYDYPGTLLCSQCNAAFSDFESFRAHIKLHIEETGGGLLGGATSLEQLKRSTEYACPHCRSVFSSMEDVSQHVITHFVSMGMEFGCENCHKSYEKVDDLQKHLMDIHSHHLYSCSICNEVFESKVTIQVHFSVTHSVQSKTYRCKVCLSPNATFHSEEDFTSHIKTVHADNAPFQSPFAIHNVTQALRCLICHMTFQTELDLQLHLATHGKQFQCTLCPQSFHIEYLLDKHMQTHQHIEVTNKYENCTELTSFTSCATTSSKMSSNSVSPTLKKVENNNNSDENFTYCDICEKGEFNNETELIAHKKLVHNIKIATGKENNENREEKLIELAGIKINNKQLSPKQGLTSPVFRQEKSSVDINAVSTFCDICERRDFVNEAELLSHKKLIHHIKAASPGKVSLHCAYCNENCKSRSELENHMKSHSQNSSTSGKHKCIICDEMCPTAAVLAEHKLTHCKVLSGKTCMQCKGSITTEEQFYCHIQQHSAPSHNSNNNNCNGNTKDGTKHLILPTVCVICRQTLVSEMEAKMHARFHLHQSLDTVPCSVCFQMSDRQDLIAGICRECYQRHGKSSPFRCPECYMNFESGTAIEIHIATIHRKNYQCVKCQVTFESEKDVQQHVATHLMIDGLNSHECRLCRRVLPTPLQLQAHLIEHTFAGCSTFTCYLCSSVFTTAQSLQTHILEHGLSARPYDCPRCNQKFFFTSELEHHSYVHLEEINTNNDDYRYRHQENIQKNQGRMAQNMSTHLSFCLPKNLTDYEKHPKINGTERHLQDCLQMGSLEQNRNFYNVATDNDKCEPNKTGMLHTAEEGNIEQRMNDTDIAGIKKEIKQEFPDSEEEQIDVVTTKSEQTSQH